MKLKTHEMSKMPSPKHAEMSTELEALRQARDLLRAECTELQSRTNDDLSDDESRRYAVVCVHHIFSFLQFKCIVIVVIEKLYSRILTVVDCICTFSNIFS